MMKLEVELTIDIFMSLIFFLQEIPQMLVFHPTVG